MESDANKEYIKRLKRLRNLKIRYLLVCFMGGIKHIGLRKIIYLGKWEQMYYFSQRHSRMNLNL